MKLNIILCLSSLINLLVSSLPILESEERKEETNFVGWDYEQRGPDKWNKIYGTCADEEQSPIDVQYEYLKCNPDILKPLQLNDYEKDIDFKFIHDGHTIVAHPLYQKFPLELDGAGLPFQLGPYELLQFHFHWGSDYFEGSEHSINGRVYPLELHLVHTSSKNKKILAVVGVLFELIDYDNIFLNDLLAPFSYLSLREQNLSTVEEIKENPIRKRKAMITNLNLMNILSIRSTDYFFYDGSLTTPPCTQGVKWILLNSTVGISRAQLDIFHANVVKKNNRNVQKLNKRVIYTNNELYCNDTDTANEVYRAYISLYIIYITLVSFFINI